MEDMSSWRRTYGNSSISVNNSSININIIINTEKFYQQKKKKQIRSFPINCWQINFLWIKFFVSCSWHPYYHSQIVIEIFTNCRLYLLRFPGKFCSMSQKLLKFQIDWWPNLKVGPKLSSKHPNEVFLFRDLRILDIRKTKISKRKVWTLDFISTFWARLWHWFTVFLNFFCKSTKL